MSNVISRRFLQIDNAFLDRINGDNMISSSAALEHDNHALFCPVSRSVIESVTHYVQHRKKFFFPPSDNDVAAPRVCLYICRAEHASRVRLVVAITVLRLIGYPASPTCSFPSMRHYDCLFNHTRGSRIKIFSMSVTHDIRCDECFHARLPNARYNIYDIKIHTR